MQPELNLIHENVLLLTDNEELPPYFKSSAVCFLYKQKSEGKKILTSSSNAVTVVNKRDTGDVLPLNLETEMVVGGDGGERQFASSRRPL